MEGIHFVCESCGNEVSRNLLPGKHAINGAINAINRKQACCGAPRYVDDLGIADSTNPMSIRELIPGIRV